MVLNDQKIERLLLSLKFKNEKTQIFSLHQKL